MQDRVNTSWRRLSDERANHVDSGSARDTQTSPPHVTEAQRIEAWEDEGGKTGPPPHVTEAQRIEAWEDEGGKTGLSSQPVRVLIVDNDMSSADSLEVMLHAFGHSQTRVAYSGHAALAIGAEFRPDVVLLEINPIAAVAQALPWGARQILGQG
jgi:PleD family two-component response regulator